MFAKAVSKSRAVLALSSLILSPRVRAAALEGPLSGLPPTKADVLLPFATLPVSAIIPAKKRRAAM